jgi:hypothetical protein
MCWMCDNPEATFEDYDDLVRSAIDRDGWFVQSVQPGRRQPGFSYTVGLTALGRPELLVTGRPMRVARDLLNGITAHLVHHEGGRLRPGDHVLLRDHPDIEVVRVAEPTVHLVTACNIYGPGVDALQLVYADDRGKWPWDVGFRGRQPVLGPRSTGSTAPS